MARLTAFSQSYYISDTWKPDPTSRSSGLRYEFTPPWTDIGAADYGGYSPNTPQPQVADLSLHPDWSAPATVTSTKTPGSFLSRHRQGRPGNRLIKADYMNFAPRLGAAWA